MSRLTEDKRMLEYDLMLPYSNIFCFSTTRHGGVGKGMYDSFNCTPYTGDDRYSVERNLALLRSLMPAPVELVIPYQTHGTQILRIDDKFTHASEMERNAFLQKTDALITDCEGYCLCISTADCVPVLLYDRVHWAVAAIHAGWRGTAACIVETVLQCMSSTFGTCGKDIVACIGPSISLEAFETGEEVFQLFKDQGFPMECIAHRHSQTGKWHLDLWEANRLQLTLFGVPESQIEIAGICTYAQYNDFFSARRLGIKSGRILSGIMIKKDKAFYEYPKVMNIWI